jgi:hypothetical protein
MINFSAGTSIMSASGAKVGNVTVVIVGKATLESGSGTILMTNLATWTTDSFQIQINANARTINCDVNGATAYNTTGSFTDNTAFLLVYTASIYNGTITRTTRLNGAADTTSAVSSTSTDLDFSSFTIGNSNDQTRTMNGGLSAIAVYNYILSSAQIELIEGFMAWKWWGSGSVLPTTHPFKNQPPTGYKTVAAPPVDTPLYDFTSMTFTRCGATGATGPTLAQLQSTYLNASGGGAWTQDTNNLNMETQGIQIWTVPVTGTYEFIVAGARGGRQSLLLLPRDGGGIIIIGEVKLQKGQKIHIVVGQEGTGISTNGSGGGGGSFVVLDGNVPLLIAGGGGGAGRDWRYSSKPTLTVQGGYWARFSPNAAGQTRPGEGGITTASNSGGGGGFYTSGLTSASGGVGGSGFLQGAAGAGGTYAGGFGGGGAGFSAVGGGGGGFTGGSGSDTRGANAGAGGGSYYVNGPSCKATLASTLGFDNDGYQYDNGYITVTYLN